MAEVTICSDFGAPKNKVSHCFHCFSIYLSEIGMMKTLWRWVMVKLYKCEQTESY